MMMMLRFRRVVCPRGLVYQRARGVRRRAVPSEFEKKTNLPFAHTLVKIAAGGSVFTFAVFGAWIAVQPDKEFEQKELQCACATRLKAFDSASETYDSTVGRDELFMGMPILRWWLLRSARGHVLEIAAGTGTNLGWYPSECHVTATDASKSMLLQAARKIKHSENNIQLLRLSVEDIPRLLLQNQQKRYDTIVDTFGLCSVEDPVHALRIAQTACKETSSRILLLEHGRSHFSWLNHHLDKYAPYHLKKWGCNWNRDILKIVQDAGLTVESYSRWHFGTTYLIIATPDPSLIRPTPSS